MEVNQPGLRDEALVADERHEVGTCRTADVAQQCEVVEVGQVGGPEAGGVAQVDGQQAGPERLLHRLLGADVGREGEGEDYVSETNRRILDSSSSASGASLKARVL